MSPTIRRIVFSLAVIAWGGVLLYFYASGRIQRYLAPDFRLLALVGGLGMMVLGCFNLFTANYPTACGHDHHEPGNEHSHGGETPTWLVLLVMVVPLFLATAWTKDEYSAAALSRKGLYDSPAEAGASFLLLDRKPLDFSDIERTHPKTADGYYVFELLEVFFAAGDREMQTLIDGLKIETEGRLMDERAGSAEDHRKRLYRLFITCCAADSRAIPIVLMFRDSPPAIDENAWVKVAGTLRFPLEGGQLQAVVEVDRVELAPAPAEESFLRD